SAKTLSSSLTVTRGNGDWSKVNFDARPSLDRNPPRLLRRFVLMDSLEILVRVDPLLDPLSDRLQAGPKHDLRRAEKSPFGRGPLCFHSTPQILGRDRNDHEIGVQRDEQGRNQVGLRWCRLQPPPPGHDWRRLRIPGDFLVYPLIGSSG